MKWTQDRTKVDTGQNTRTSINLNPSSTEDKLGRGSPLQLYELRVLEILGWAFSQAAASIETEGG